MTKTIESLSFTSPKTRHVLRRKQTQLGQGRRQGNFTQTISPLFGPLRHQENIVTSVAESYLALDALDPTAAGARAGAGALAGAVTAYAVRFHLRIACGVQ